MFTLKEFLKSEVKPALGCTEPGAVALAVARACRELNQEKVCSIKIILSDNVYKNGMDVCIPGEVRARGNIIAAALAAICGNSGYGLEVLKDCSREDISAAQKWLGEDRVEVKCNLDKHGVFVEATVETEEDKVICIIEDDHSHISRVIKNGEIIWQDNSSAVNNDRQIQEMITDLTYLKVLSLAEEMDQEDLEFLLQGVEMNLQIAEYGLEEGKQSGFSFGRTLQQIMKQQHLEGDPGYILKSYCYAASDARMGGALLPVMSSAGSGNHGITAIIPVALIGRLNNKSREEIGRAIAISHLTTSFIKSKVGRLSSVCGCAFAAGAGAAAGITKLLGGTLQQIILAVNTLMASTAGMICDGAKESCSLKVGIAAFEAYISALFSLQNRGINIPQGVIEDSVEETSCNIGMINQQGMDHLEEVMINIIEKRHTCSKD